MKAVKDMNAMNVMKEVNTMKRYRIYKAVNGFDVYQLKDEGNGWSKEVFNNLKTAVDRPHGPAYMQYADTPHEYSRIALAYGLANEYTASGGDKLEEIYG